MLHLPKFPQFTYTVGREKESNREMEIVRACLTFAMQLQQQQQRGKREWKIAKKFYQTICINFSRATLASTKCTHKHTTIHSCIAPLHASAVRGTDQQQQHQLKTYLLLVALWVQTTVLVALPPTIIPMSAKVALTLALTLSFYYFLSLVFWCCFYVEAAVWSVVACVFIQSAELAVQGCLSFAVIFCGLCC